MSLFQLFLYLAILTLCIAHSWVERVNYIFMNGSLSQDNPGYIRGAVPRSPTFDDHQMQNLLPQPYGRCKPALSNTDRICKDTQTIGNYSEEFPMLVVSPGDYIALQYKENGHITLPSNSPQKNSSGNIYIYGTSSPSDNDKLLDIHHVWTMDGTGGDGRGRLLAIWPFDDGRCYEKNDGKISSQRQQSYKKDDVPPQGADLWCQADFRIPGDEKVGTNYTVYWVWDWPSIPTEPYPSGQPEIYTSCMDVEIFSEPTLLDMEYEKDQDLNYASIEEQVMSKLLWR